MSGYVNVFVIPVDKTTSPVAITVFLVHFNYQMKDRKL